MTNMREARHITIPVKVGGVTVGGAAPVVVQSMTNTDTADIDGTVRQVAQLAQAGSEIVRITVDRDEAAAAVPHIHEKLLKMGVNVPLVGDFHYIGHKLLSEHRACAEALAPVMSASGTNATSNFPTSSKSRSSTTSRSALA